MDTKTLTKMIVVSFVTCLLVIVGLQAYKCLNRISKQTEQNFADAMRVMQGEDVGR